MGKEIERKFLVQSPAWRQLADAGVVYAQGYLTRADRATVRVRVAGNQGFLTIKSPTQGISRQEYEYGIPVNEAWELLTTLCFQPLIEKTRYKIPLDGLLWEIDEFWGQNLGLVLAEVELDRADQVIILPSWIGREVSHDQRYFNSYLNQHPYADWGKSPETHNPEL